MADSRAQSVEDELARTDLGSSWRNPSDETAGDRRRPRYARRVFATSSARSAAPPRIAPAIELRSFSPGTVRYEAFADVRLSIHAGAPARVTCSGGERAVSTRGEICLLPSGVGDEWVADDPSVLLDVGLPPSLVRTVAEEMGLDPSRVELEARSCIRDEHIEHIAWALEADRRAGSPSGSLYRESLGFALAGHLLARYPTTPPPPSSASRYRTGLSSAQLARVKEYIEEHLAGDVSLVRLARVAAASASHFRVLFKQSTGYSVHEYVIRRRVERARRLLRTGELPVSQVAFESGFAHGSHLARCMRRVLGMTPAQVSERR
jgi:AraC family transcriptional regulator